MLEAGVVILLRFLSLIGRERDRVQQGGRVSQNERERGEGGGEK